MTAATHTHVERLARRGTASLLGAGFNSISSIVVVILVAQGLSQGSAGILFAGTSTFLIIEAIVLLGTDTALVRWLPAHRVAGRRGDIRLTLRISLLPVCLLATGGGVALFWAAPWVASVTMGDPGPDDSMVDVLRVLALALPVATAHDAVLAATRGLGTMRPTVLVENVGRLAIQAGAIFVVNMAGGGLVALTAAWAAPYLPALIGSALWLRLLMRPVPGAPAPATPDRGSVTRAFWGYAAPRAITRITQSALKRSDILLVAALSSASDAALYTAATRFIVFGQVLVQAVQQALSPHLSSLFAQKNRRAADAIFRAATAWSMVVSWPVYLLTAVFSPELMRVFGAGYEDAYPVVVVLSLTMLFATASGPVDAVLLMSGRSWASLLNNSVALVINIVLNILLIPSMGIQGAAYSWAVAIGVRNLLPLTQVRRNLGMWPVGRASTYVAVGNLMCFGIIVGGSRLLGVPLVVLVIATGLAALLYVGLLWLLREPLELAAFGALRRSRRRPVTPPDAGPVRSSHAPARD